MSNYELKVAHKVRQALNAGTETLDNKIADRLFEARQHALEHHNAKAGGMALAGWGRLVSDILPARSLIAACALALGVVFSYYWNHFEQAAENEEVDSALLSDDLPPAAYLDKGFQAWLDRSSLSSH